jgi:hypothetical protein
MAPRRDQSGDENGLRKLEMRKGVLLLAVLLAACFATTADAAKKKAAKPAVDPGLAAQERSNAFIAASFQPWTTTLSAPATPKAAKKGKKKASKKGKAKAA